MRRIELMVGGRKASAVVADQGTSLVLLSGFFQSAQRFVEAGWVDALSTDFQGIAVDLAGYGDASKRHESADYTADAFVSDLFGSFDLVGVDRAHLIGYSQGAGRACYLPRPGIGCRRCHAHGLPWLK